MDQFSPGDVVTLRSGGPRMTVESVDPAAGGDQSVVCVWIVRDETLVRETFSGAMLSPVSDAAGGASAP